MQTRFRVLVFASSIYSFWMIEVQKDLQNLLRHPLLIHPSLLLPLLPPTPPRSRRRPAEQGRRPQLLLGGVTMVYHFPLLHLLILFWFVLVVWTNHHTIINAYTVSPLSTRSIFIGPPKVGGLVPLTRSSWSTKKGSVVGRRWNVFHHDDIMTPRPPPASSKRCSNSHIFLMDAAHEEEEEGISYCVNNDDPPPPPEEIRRSRRKYTIIILGLASAIAWTLTSIVVLSYHPDPKFVNCSLQHNLFTMGQALAFPLPVLAGVIGSLSKKQHHHNTQKQQQQQRINKSRRSLQLGLTVSMLWLAASTIHPGPFCFGYELIRPKILQQISTAVYLLLAFVTVQDWWNETMTTMIGGGSSSSSSKTNKNQEGRVGRRRCSNIIHGCVDSIFELFNPPPPKTADENENDGTPQDQSRIYALASLGLFWFTLLPIVSSYPLATIPSILGKRLSRPASAWTWLGAVSCLSLSRKKKEDNDDTGNTTSHNSLFHLRRGLFIGSLLHLTLIALKLIGVDDGGFLLPGTGLWDWYPAMMMVPFATITSCLIHGLIVFAGL